MSSLHKHHQLHELYVKQVKKAVPPNKRNDPAWLKNKIEEATKDNVSVNVNLSVKLPSVSGGSGSTPPTSKKKKISFFDCPCTKFNIFRCFIDNPQYVKTV